MQSRPNPLLGLISREYFETFDLYSPRDTDFRDLVSAKLPPDWWIQRSGIWFHCGSSSNVVPEQGWKIHVSATVSDARETLNRVLSVLVHRRDTNFKFALDSYLLSLLNGKNWSRGGSGKFITVYPKDAQCFLELIEELHQATVGQRGPYILSDRQYQNNSVVFYRYGGMRQRHTLNIAGNKVPLLTGSDGADVPDRRLPFPVTPDWVDVPFQSTPGEGSLNRPLALQNDRYEIIGVLAFSNAGGVYCALDQKTGKRVVVKEARQYIGSSGGDCNAVELLQKEHRLLTLLSHTGIAPHPYDLFQDWDHWFLVEEFIEGIPLARHIANSNILLRTRPSPEDFDLWYAGFRSLFRNLLHIVDVMHRHRVVFGDLSPNNLLLTAASPQLKLIDFEGACQLGVDAPINLYTPGFGSPNQVNGGPATPEDDYYALGAIVCFCLFPLNGLLNLYPHARHELLRNIQNDTQIPAPVIELISDLLHSDPALRPSSSKIEKVLSDFPARDRHICDGNERPIDCRVVIDSIQDHIYDTASYSRKDRLFPADPKLFSTNPLSLAYGASGIVYALNKISNHFPGQAVNWILQHEITPDNYPPGLYVGLSGIAWCLLEIGLQPEAEQIFRIALSHPLRQHSADIFYGQAGWGMTCLRFFLATRDEEYLVHARQAAATLLKTSVRDQRGRHWTINDGRLGLAHGASGVALFLLYLYLATGDSDFLDAGHEALEYDLSFAVETKDGGLSWAQTANSVSPLYPYWHFGSAGIGRVVLRFYRLLKNQQLRAVLEKLFIESDRKYAALPGQFMGLSGLGEFSLDLYDFFGEGRFLESAEKAARGIMLFAVERNGIAFPGDQLARLSCDYGTGSAGIALFLDRLTEHHDGNFMLDSLFKSHAVSTQTHQGTIEGSHNEHKMN